jgi:hypothetical protein
VYPLDKENLKPKEMKDRETMLFALHSELKLKAAAMEQRVRSNVVSLETEVEDLKRRLEAERLITEQMRYLSGYKVKLTNFRTQLSQLEAAIETSVDERFRKAYAAKIKEFKEIFETMRDWQRKFSSKDKLDERLHKFQSSIKSL